MLTWKSWARHVGLPESLHDCSAVLNLSAVKHSKDIGGPRWLCQPASRSVLLQDGGLPGQTHGNMQNNYYIFLKYSNFTVS